MNEQKSKPIFRCVEDCETQEWNHPHRGHVKWWELINGDITSTTGLTMGIAEVPVGAPSPKRGHTHDAEEVYVVYFSIVKNTNYFNFILSDIIS